MRLKELLEVRQPPTTTTPTNNSAILRPLVNTDQNERNSYKQFVNTKAGGDYDKGAQMWAKAHNRPSNDIFGERTRLATFMQAQNKFDFTTFQQQDWDDYWLLAQHCDANRDFQKQALGTIQKYLGTNNNHYKYLYDRISCGLQGTQKYNTQDICNRDN